MVRRTPPDTLPWLLFISGLTLSFLLSAQALLELGIPYDAPYGPMVAKLHPGSYLLILAWLAALLRHGNPLVVAARLARRQPVLAAYMACMVLVFVWVVLRHGTSGAAYIVQTLWVPGCPTRSRTGASHRHTGRGRPRPAASGAKGQHSACAGTGRTRSG